LDTSSIRISDDKYDSRCERGNMADVTTLLSAVGSGTSSDANELFQLLYLELRSLAHQQSQRHAEPALHTTTLVHEAYLRFRASGELRVEDRRHFLAYASHVMRSIVVDHARNQLAAKRGSGHALLPLDTSIINSATASDDEVVRVHDALAELTALDERLGKIVEMKYFGGMTEEEIADALELSSRTVQRDWEKARLFLSASMQET
jgi:RNA polymerase sigma factor (TIGR02999 family)